MTEEKKTQILDLVFLHGSKIAEAIEALRLLKQALRSVDAGEPLRSTLEAGGDGIAQVLAVELAENAIYAPIWEAQRHMQHAEENLRQFIRLFKESYGIAKHRGQSHD